MAVEAPERLYRFPLLDRTGWVLGLQGSQCVALGAGALIAGLLLNAGAPGPLVLAPAAGALAWCFARLGGRPAHEWAPVVLSWVAGRFVQRRTWESSLPLLTGTPSDEERQPDLPPWLAGLRLLRADGAPLARQVGPAGVAVLRDDSEQTWTGVLRVRGQEFALCERREQDRLLQLWGDALAAFCAERSAVGRVAWSEWAAPAGLDEQLRFLDEHRASAADSAAVRSYLDLLEDAGPLATRHDVLVTVTLDARRLRRNAPGADPDDAAVAALLEELRLLTTRLEASGLVVDPPLSPVQLATALRLRCDPGSRERLAARGRTLGELVGVVSPYNAGPLATATHWDHLAVDGSLHRSYWVAEWPRLEVPANWLEPVLLHAGGVRGFTVVHEPVPPSRSQRQVDRDSTKLASDEEHRSRSGFRVGARHRRAQAAVAEREVELVAGYAELEYAGLVTVTARTQEELDRSCAEYEQAAAQAGLELRRLDGRHDRGFACGLPLGRGLARGPLG